MAILCIEKIENTVQLAKWLDPMFALLAPWLSVLEEDRQQSMAEKGVLFENLSAVLPYLWIATDDIRQVIATASLTVVTPGHSATLHGVRALAYRKHPMIRELAWSVLSEAFQELRVNKLKAQFEADNVGALGFCRLYGFQKEAHFREESLKQGQRKDVVSYALFQPQYQVLLAKRYERR